MPKKQRIKLNTSDVICPKFLSSKKSSLIFDRIQSYVDLNASIENILKNIQDVEKIKFLLLDEHELLAYQYISNPNLIIDVSIGEQDKIQKLWNKVNHLNVRKDSQLDFIKLQNYMTDENSSETLKKITSLI